MEAIATKKGHTMNSLFNLDREWCSRVCQILDTLSSRKQTLVDRGKDQSKGFFQRNVPFSYQMQWRSAVWLSEAQRSLFTLNVLLTLSRPKARNAPSETNSGWRMHSRSTVPCSPVSPGLSGLYLDSWRIGHSSSPAAFSKRGAWVAAEKSNYSFLSW